MKHVQLKFKWQKKTRSLTGLFFLLHTHLGNYSLFAKKKAMPSGYIPFNFKGMYAKSIDVKH